MLELAQQAVEKTAKAVAARTRLAELEGERDTAAEARQAAEDAVAAAGTALAGAWQAYAAGVRELDLPHPDEMGLVEWAATLDGPNPAEAALRSAAASATRVLAAAQARAEGRARGSRPAAGGPGVRTPPAGGGRDGRRRRPTPGPTGPGQAGSVPRCGSSLTSPARRPSSTGLVWRRRSRRPGCSMPGSPRRASFSTRGPMT